VADNIWAGVIAGLASIYSQKKKKDAAIDQYRYQEQELERKRQYMEEAQRAKQNAPSAKMAKYLTAYYLPQYVDKIKKRNKGGNSEILDQMLADIMGGLNLDGTGGGGGDAFDSFGGSVAQVGGKRVRGLDPQVKEDARKAGAMSIIAGKVDPEIDGYSGKGWSNGHGGNAALEGAPSGGGGAWGTSAFEVGGQRENTRNMGSTTTQTERGYTVNTNMPWNMIDEGADQAWPNQQGQLATGGTLNVATDGVDVSQLLSLGAMMGIGQGPRGTVIGPNGTYGDGNFQMSDIVAWADKHPVLSGILRSGVNMVVPGMGTLLNSGIRAGVNRGVGDGVKGNAGIRKISNRKS
jgi:hypothetical protein